jgi:hypothetical protein
VNQIPESNFRKQKNKAQRNGKLKENRENQIPIIFTPLTQCPTRSDIVYFLIASGKWLSKIIHRN